jgi:hypothetical protein
MVKNLPSDLDLENLIRNSNKKHISIHQNNIFLLFRNAKSTVVYKKRDDQTFIPEFSLVLNILREGLDFVEASRPFQSRNVQGMKLLLYETVLQKGSLKSNITYLTDHLAHIAMIPVKAPPIILCTALYIIFIGNNLLIPLINLT